MDGLKKIIMAHSFFHDMQPEYLDIVAAGATVAEFKPDQILFREGDPANQFYLIEQGTIALEVRQPGADAVLVQNLGAGEVLGWSWMFPPFLWHFQARAVEPTRTIVLSGAHLLIAAERQHDFGYELMKRVAQVVIQRLHTTHQKLRVQLTHSERHGKCSQQCK